MRACISASNNTGALYSRVIFPSFSLSLLLSPLSRGLKGTRRVVTYIKRIRRQERARGVALPCRIALSFLTPPADPLPSSRLALGNETHKNKRVPAGEAERCASFRACRANRTGVTFFRSSDFLGSILALNHRVSFAFFSQIHPRIPA